jgi:hypothetical protein
VSVQRPGAILVSPSFPGSLTRRHPLEAHLSRAVVIQQSPEDQPVRASIGPCVRAKTGGVGP